MLPNAGCVPRSPLPESSTSNRTYFGPTQGRVDFAQRRYFTPNIDRIADEGMLFTDSYAAEVGHRGPIAGLCSSLRGELLQPGDADYDGARQIWNGMFDKKPALIARCRGTADVIDAVNFARENGLLTAVRCGGHNSSGSGSCDGGILIDLSAMNAVHVDPKTRRARLDDVSIFCAQ
jgi:FAD binding domain